MVYIIFVIYDIHPMPYRIDFSNPVSVRTSPNMPVVKPFSMKSLFTDNSRVVYKKGSLPSGGVGTVRNATRKGQRT